MREMPRFTECIWALEIQPMHMTLRFLTSICFNNLKDHRNTKLKFDCNVNQVPKVVSIHEIHMEEVGYGPHSMIPEKGRSGSIECHFEQAQGLVNHPQLHISSAQH